MSLRKPRSTASRRPGQVSLERALSKLGLASRTVAREWIQAGRVRVNGEVRRLPAYPVNPGKARIEIDGERAQAAEFRALLLHKPRGVVTTRSDEKGRPTVFSTLKLDGPTPNLHAVGRLDWATSGLLILTNNTRLSAWLTDPANGVSRIYLVTVRGEVTPDEIRKIESGIQSEGETLRAEKATLRKASGRESHLTLELREGKNREIRRLLGEIGHEVIRLKRVAYGGLELGELEPGECREVGLPELRAAFPGCPAIK